jgi:hypothetical protein
VETEVNSFTEEQPVILIYLTMALYKQSHFYLIIRVKIAKHLPIPTSHSCVEKHMTAPVTDLYIP